MKLESQQTSLEFTPKLIIQLAIVVIVIPFIPLLVSLKWSWWEAWVYGIVFAVGFIASRVLASQRHPDLLAERAQSLEKEDAKSWDRILGPLLGVGIIIVSLVAGLEWRWNITTSFNLEVRVAALIILLFGYIWSSYALIENRFFSGLVRIQEERDHHVVSTGPYRWMRHPGYSGLLLIYLATPVFLNSAWAFIPTILFILVLIVRTYLEDKTLQEELPGYRAYTQKVTGRLVPGIW